MKPLSRYPVLSGTALLALVAGGAFACNDFLETPPQGALDESTLATPAGVEATLIAAYRSLDWNTGVGGAWGSAASNWVWGSVTSDEAYKGSENLDQPPITDIELYNWGTGGAHDYLNDKWRSVYEGVVRSNATLRLLKTVLAEKPGEMSQADADGIKGEALFLRAHFHFEAWKMWRNIPYYIEDDTDVRKPNTGVDAATNIAKDLDDAIALLPTAPRKGQKGRATRWTARAYKGRVQVFRGDHAGALTTLRDVRLNGPFALEGNYHQVWTAIKQFANGPETVLAYQASVNDGESGGNNSNWGERLNFPHSGAPLGMGGCCGFHQPTQNLVNFFRTDAAGLPLAVTDPNWNASDAELDAAASATVFLDPRLDWTVGRDGVPFKDWGAHAAGWIRDPAFGGPYSPKKNIHERAATDAVSKVGWQPTQLNAVNIHILRYADVLLLLAEAEVEAGDINTARDLINQIRARAGQVCQGPGTDAATIAVPCNDASITWAVYNVGQYPAAGWNQALARTAVRYERKLELAMEGQRFFDLRRWGTAATVLNDYVNIEKRRRPHLGSAAAFAARHELYPLPALQVELSKIGGESRLTQNPGW